MVFKFGEHLYEIIGDDQNPQALRDLASGHEIPFDPDNQGFNDFLSRWSQGVEKVTNTKIEPPPGFYFSDYEELIKHCRVWGTVLRVNGSGDRGRFDFVENPFPIAHGKYHQLAEAVAATTRSGLSDRTFLSRRANLYLTDQLWHHCNSLLSDEDSEIRKCSSWPVKRAFAYFDVSDFSTYPPGHQMLIVNSINNLVRHGEINSYPLVQEFKKKELETMLCIGDGYILVCKDAVSAAYLSAMLAREIELRAANNSLPVSFHFRVGIHIGEVYRFWDAYRNNWNYIGDGINGGQRVLSAIGKETDDVMYISGQVRDELLKDKRAFEPTSRIIDSLQNRGRHKDKHENPWRVYELNHTRACNSFNLTVPLNPLAAREAI